MGNVMFDKSKTRHLERGTRLWNVVAGGLGFCYVEVQPASHHRETSGFIPEAENSWRQLKANSGRHLYGIWSGVKINVPVICKVIKKANNKSVIKGHYCTYPDHSQKMLWNVLWNQIQIKMLSFIIYTEMIDKLSVRGCYYMCMLCTNPCVSMYVHVNTLNKRLLKFMCSHSDSGANEACFSASPLFVVAFRAGRQQLHCNGRWPLLLQRRRCAYLSTICCKTRWNSCN